MTKWQSFCAALSCCLCFSTEAFTDESLPTRSVIFQSENIQVGLWARNFSTAPSTLRSRCPITRKYRNILVPCRAALSLDEVAHTKDEKASLSEIIRGRSLLMEDLDPSIAVSARRYPRLERRFYMFDEPVPVSAIFADPKVAFSYPTRDAAVHAAQTSRLDQISLDHILFWTLGYMYTTQSFELIDGNNAMRVAWNFWEKAVDVTRPVCSAYLRQIMAMTVRLEAAATKR